MGQKQELPDQRQHPTQMESEELSDYPGEDMASGREATGEDMGESSQVSPS